MIWIGYIIATGIGYLIGKSTEADRKKAVSGIKKLGAKDKKEGAWVYVRTNDWDKLTLMLPSKEKAKALFDKIKKSKKLTYQTALKDPNENELYKKWKKEGTDRPKLTDTSRVENVEWGTGNETIDNKSLV